MAFDTLWMNEIGDYIALKNYVEISARNVDSILALKGIRTLILVMTIKIPHLRIN